MLGERERERDRERAGAGWAVRSGLGEADEPLDDDVDGDLRRRCRRLDRCLRGGADHKSVRP